MTERLDLTDDEARAEAEAALTAEAFAKRDAADKARYAAELAAKVAAEAEKMDREARQRDLDQARAEAEDALTAERLAKRDGDDDEARYQAALAAEAAKMDEEDRRRPDLAAPSRPSESEAEGEARYTAKFAAALAAKQEQKAERAALEASSPESADEAAAALAKRDADALAECEAVIARGLRTFVDVGEALLRVRDGRLYRETHSSFEDYCRERWGFSKTQANRNIEAAAVVAELTPIGVTGPANESVARELAPLRAEPEQLRDTWAEVRDLHGEKPTALQVRQVVADRQQDEPEPAPEPGEHGAPSPPPPTPPQVRAAHENFRHLYGGLHDLDDIMDTLERNPPTNLAFVAKAEDLAKLELIITRSLSRLRVLRGALKEPHA